MSYPSLAVVEVSTTPHTRRTLPFSRSTLAASATADPPLVDDQLPSAARAGVARTSDPAPRIVTAPRRGKPRPFTRSPPPLPTSCEHGDGRRTRQWPVGLDDDDAGGLGPWALRTRI